MRHLISAGDLSREQVLALFELAADLKQRWKAGHRDAPLAGRSIALIFEKPSLRTRVTFEVGVVQLGGRAVYLSGGEIGLGTRESPADVARNLSRWVDAIAARVFKHATVETLARSATEWKTLLPSPIHASRVRDRSSPRSHSVNQSASAWHGCSKSERALMTGMVACRASASTVACV